MTGSQFDEMEAAHTDSLLGEVDRQAEYKKSAFSLKAASYNHSVPHFKPAHPQYATNTGVTEDDVYKFVSLEEIENMPPQTWQIDKVFPNKSTVIIYGAPKGGKSFVALDISYSISLGVSWMGREVQQGTVLYISAEGWGGLRKRARAYRKHHSITNGINPPIHFYHSAIDFGNPTDLDKLRRSLNPVLIRDVRLIVIDTLNRNMKGNENSSQDVAIFMNGLSDIQTEFNLTCLVVHHLGKNEENGARGSSAIRGAIDVGIVVKPCEDGTIEISNTEQKDEDPFEPFYVNKISVELGGDESSLVLELNETKRHSTKKAGRPSTSVPAVYEVIRTKAGLSVKKQIAEAAGVTEKTAAAALKYLTENNYVFVEPGQGYRATYPHTIAPWLGNGSNGNNP